MTKAYLAGFLAGTQGKYMVDCPYSNDDILCQNEWERGLIDGDNVAGGCKFTGREIV